MRISDWSSDVCSSDLLAALRMTFSSLNDRIALSLVSSRADLKYDDLLPTVQELRKAQADWPTAAKTIIKLIERLDRKSDVWGKSVSVRVDIGGRRIIKKKKLEIKSKNT